MSASLVQPGEEFDRVARVSAKASGAVYTDDAGSWAELHDAKLQALDSILAEAAGASVLVAYHWKHDLERLLKAFPRGRPVFIHHIIAAGTMDEMVMERRNSKRTVQDILLDAMKKRGQ